MEARLLSEGQDLHADVLKVGHHGSKTSTIQPFLDAVAPSIALISDGFENSFGHPNKDVLAPPPRPATPPSSAPISTASSPSGPTDSTSSWTPPGGLMALTLAGRFGLPNLIQ